MEQILDEKSFLDKYNFDNYVHVSVINPTTEDFEFVMMVQTGMDRAIGKPREEHRTFKVPAGGKERFVGSVANLYLDQMSKKIAQQEGKFASIADWTARAKYYDDLIVAVDDPYHSTSFVSYEDPETAGGAAEEAKPALPFAGLAAEDEEKVRLQRENEALKEQLAKAAAIPAGLTVDATADALEPKPFAAVASDAPKHAGGRPRKIQA